MKKATAFLACFLAILVAGFAELRRPATGSCAAVEACCCSDPATVETCVCVDHPAPESPEMAASGGPPLVARPQSGEPLIGAISPLAGLTPRWHPALPWHAPPEEVRARLAVWVL